MGTAGDGFDLVRDWRYPVGWKDEEKKPNLGFWVPSECGGYAKVLAALSQQLEEKQPDQTGSQCKKWRGLIRTHSTMKFWDCCGKSGQKLSASFRGNMFTPSTPFPHIAVVSGTHGAMVDSRPQRRIPPHQMLSGRHPRSAGLCLNGNGFTPRGSKIGQIEKLVQV